MSSGAHIITDSIVGPILGYLPSLAPEISHPTKFVILNNEQHLSETVFRLEKGSKIIFKCGPSLFGKEINIWTNHPKSAKDDFDRQSYCMLAWNEKCLDPVPTTLNEKIMVATLQIHRAGTFQYYFKEKQSDRKLGSGYFIVDPVLSFGSPHEILPLDAIRCHTVLAKSLGPFDQWEDRLRVSKESGYNMIHFTPLQVLGGSNSSYCVKDHLELNPEFRNEGPKLQVDDIIRLTNKIKKEWKVLSIGDVVLNHTANESPWLRTNQECTYNMITAPHLIPAAILDGHLHVFTKDLAQKKYVSEGLPEIIFTDCHVNAVVRYLEDVIIPEIRLHEYYQADVTKLTEEFIEKARGRAPIFENAEETMLRLINDSFSGRFKGRIDMDLALKIYNHPRIEDPNEGERLEICANRFRQRLLKLNSEKQLEINNHLRVAVANCKAYMRYIRVLDYGPQIRIVSEDHPVVPRYFTGEFLSQHTIEEEVLNNGQFVMAHNGWVMNAEPLKNFADPDSHVYLRRELNVWSDSVKLRYGSRPADSPFLWNYMKKYVEISASMFDGIRIDNCHSTPLHVAEYFLDCARKVRPDLYVVAELFTNSASIDNIFINTLGITSLIRESIRAGNSYELGRFVCSYGGEPVGSFCKKKNGPLRSSGPHVLFFDITHDNPSPVKKNPYNLIPTAALVAMSCCATGSSRGYDELVPHNIDVVSEKRFYPSWADGSVASNSLVDSNTGIISVKRILNQIHGDLSTGGFTQVSMEVPHEDVILVTRHNPITHESVILVAYTATSDFEFKTGRSLGNIFLPGQVSEVLLEARLQKKNGFIDPFHRDSTYINGLRDYEVVMKTDMPVCNSDVFDKVSPIQAETSELHFKKFSPGSIFIIKMQPHDSLKEPFTYLRELVNVFLIDGSPPTLACTLSGLGEKHINYVLYRSDEEDGESGIGAYNVPGYGSLVYCGLQGFESVLKDIRWRNDLGHPLCNNLREGDWMMDYIVGRLKVRKGTASLGVGIQEIFDRVRKVPRFLIPRYFDVIVGSLCAMIKSKACHLLSPFVGNGSTFARDLAMGTYICVGHTKSASLPPFSTNVLSPEEEEKRKVTIAAGLPHFSTGAMRAWGRDTFISLRGLLLITGRHDVARLQILGYAACLRHGLIPNLLNNGVGARYNCRDAVWWWLYSIKCYVEEVPNGEQIFHDKVCRLFPTDDSFPTDPGLNEQPLSSVMQEALVAHYKGIQFRERDAGPMIDRDMSPGGFDVTAGVHPDTGFVCGGSGLNCGTWMDKMGSDSKSGNKGVPATPRDGSAIELVALCKAVVTFLRKMFEKGLYPYSEVSHESAEGRRTTWTFIAWEQAISENFERHFWIPATPSPIEKAPQLVHRREIYKDTVGGSSPWADYQLRCNFLIALVVAPELVNPQNAWQAIKTAENLLLGPLGIKTLDPQDWNYNGNYDSSNGSGNFKVAHGFNYHQGPEWLWPVGYFLRAKLYFAKLRGEDEYNKAVMEVAAYLGRHYEAVKNSPWCGLPELTNENGAYCADSCRIQAWSMASVLEVLYDLRTAKYF